MGCGEKREIETETEKEHKRGICRRSERLKKELGKRT